MLIRRLQQVLNKDSSKLIFTELLRGGDHGSKDLTRRELHEQALSIANNLSLVAQPGSKIILCTEHGISFITTLVACIYAKLIIIPVSVPDLPQNVFRFNSIYNSSNPDFVLCTNRTIEKCKSIDQIPSFKLINISDRSDIDNQIKTQIPKLQHNRLHPEIQFNEDFPVIIQFSSGSTGHPKGYLIYGSQIVMGADESYMLAKMSSDEVFVTWLPHYHDMGLFVHILFPLLSGLRIVSMAPFDFIQKPERWLEVISKYKGTISGGAPFALSILNERVNYKKFDGLDLSSWKFLFSGSDFTPKSVLRDFRDNFKKYGLKPNTVFETYGLAENTVYVCGNRIDFVSVSENSIADSGHLTEGCVLQPELKTLIKIVSEDGKMNLKDGDIGRISISGPTLSNSYIMDGETFSLPKINGYYVTPDYGYICDNRLYISGRREDLLIINGKNFYQSDVLLQTSSVSDELNALAGCCFLDDLNTKMSILIELKHKLKKNDSYTFLEPLVKNHILKIYGIHVESVKVLGRGELERTSSGKIRKGSNAKFFDVNTKNLN